MRFILQQLSLLRSRVVSPFKSHNIKPGDTLTYLANEQTIPLNEQQLIRRFYVAV
jgi:hypothetical protein